MKKFFFRISGRVKRFDMVKPHAFDKEKEKEPKRKEKVPKRKERKNVYEKIAYRESTYK